VAVALLIVGLGSAGGPLSVALAQRAGTDNVPAVSSVALSQPAESMAVADNHLVLGGEGCTTIDVSPVSLAQRAVHASCPPGGGVSIESLAGAPYVRLRITWGPVSDAIQTEHIDPVTGRPTVGPVLITLPNWGWIHSGGVVVGGGSIWIYGGPQLLELSARSGALEHRFVVRGGTDPLLVAGPTGAWITPGVFGGSECNSTCRLYHVAPGASQVSVAMSTPGLGDEWLALSGHTVVVDVVSITSVGYIQKLKGLDVVSGRTVFDTTAYMLPGPTFAGYGYLVVGSSDGLLTLSELRPRGRTPTTVSCANGAPVGVVRINPTTGAQSEVAVLAKRAVKPDCSTVPLIGGQAVVYDDALYFLSDPTSQAHFPLSRLVRVRL